ncbi:MAG: hypothetical protein ABI274_18235 [Ktedonobacterales bacterium]
MMSNFADLPQPAVAQASQSAANADELTRLWEHAHRVINPAEAPAGQHQLLLFTCGHIRCAAPLAELRKGPRLLPPLVPLPFSPPWLLGIFLHQSASEIIGLADPMPILTGDPTATGGPWLAPEPAGQQNTWPFPAPTLRSHHSEHLADFAAMPTAPLAQFNSIEHSTEHSVPARLATPASVSAPPPQPLCVMIVGSGERSLAFAVNDIDDMAAASARELLPIEALNSDVPLPFRREYLSAFYTPAGADSCYVLHITRLLDDMLRALEQVETGEQADTAEVASGVPAPDGWEASHG